MLPLYDNIRRRRIELGMSQQELAEKTGYTDRSSIAKIESGKVDLTQSKIVAIAKALEISPAYLMGWEVKKEANPLLKELTSEQAELIRLFDSAPPELQSAALGFLKAYEAQRQSKEVFF